MPGVPLQLDYAYSNRVTLKGIVLKPVRAYRSPLWLTRSLLPSSLGRSPSLRNASLILRHSIDNRRRRIRSPPPETALPPSARFEGHSSRICVRPENRPNCRASLPKCGRLLL